MVGAQQAGMLNTSMLSALKSSPGFRDYLSDHLGANDTGEQNHLISRLSTNQGLQTRVAQGLEEYRATYLGKNRTLPTSQETEVEALRIVKGILDVDKDLEKSNIFFRQFEWN